MMELIVQMIQDPPSLIHLHCLAFPRFSMSATHAHIYTCIHLCNFRHLLDLVFCSFNWLYLLHFIQGSARQLFQRLQGPMEEDTLKTHFENIIRIGKKQHYQWSQVLDFFVINLGDSGMFLVLRKKVWTS